MLRRSYQESPYIWTEERLDLRSLRFCDFEGLDHDDHSLQTLRQKDASVPGKCDVLRAMNARDKAIAIGTRTSAPIAGL